MKFQRARRRLADIACSALVFIISCSPSVNALSGNYTYANHCSYYTAYGPSSYWYKVNSEGYCGHISSSCSPNYMKYTYSAGCSSAVNYAKWDNTNSAQYGTEKIFVPEVHATSTAAPYTISYGGASSYDYTLNQLAYSDVWVTTTRLYDIRLTWLEDNSCEGSSTEIGFDEIRISY